MKKLFLLLAAGFSIVSANAQLAKQSIVKTGVKTSNLNNSHVGMKAPVAQPGSTAPAASPLAKTTDGGDSRWYNIMEAIGAAQTLSGNNISTLLTQTIYNNNVAHALVSEGTLDTLFLSTYGCQFDAAGTRFNDPFNTTYDNGAIAVTRSNSYIIDTAIAYGIYHRRATDTVTVDTLRVVFESISATALSTISDANGSTNLLNAFGSSTLSFPQFTYDSARNTAAGTIVKDFYLTAASVLDTIQGVSPIPGSAADLTGVSAYKIPLSGFTIAANQLAGASVTFISGDTTFKTGQTDTVFSADPTTGTITNIKHNFFSGLFGTENPGGDATYISTAPYDYNTGGIQENPTIQNGFDVSYYPTLILLNDLQYAYMDFHVVCSSCNDVSVNNVTKIISTANAYPNPASSQVNIPFTLSQSATVNVTVVNTLGQTVNTQNFTNVTSGKATFNTSAFATGIYFYTVEANGERMTGRFVVAHS